MGKRYLCDYCDKTFPDNPTNRRNHLNGVQHRTMRKLYYDAFQGKIWNYTIHTASRMHTP